ncbi:hypothetical protein HA402_004436 [Bradysia odoriphaga]|nr:hypothetical protein HA402_004436 [Bradysia odoriphaga]
MNKLVTTVLGHQLTQKLAHQWLLFQHKNGSKKIVQVLPSFLAGCGVGYLAAHYKTGLDTVLENFLKYADRADKLVESSVDNEATVTKVETKIGTDELVSPKTANQMNVEIVPVNDDEDK